MRQTECCDLSEMVFDNAFFEDEVREGFFVMSMVKRYWAAQLKVLSEIDRICRKHDIRWFADYGTLIGAVRHGGFVPWDDDMDISMLRSDYERFFEAARTELPEGYKILTAKDEPEYAETIGRIVNSHAINYGTEHLSAFYGCPYTVGIDIYPLDNVYDDESKEAERAVRANKVSQAIKLVDAGEAKSFECRRLLKDIEQENDFTLYKSNNLPDRLRWQLMKLLEQIYSECKDDNSKNVAIMVFYTGNGDHLFARKLYESRVELEFENTRLWVPGRYEEVLSIEYGSFMQVFKGGGMHEYPVYIDQEKILKEQIKRNPYRYTFDYNALLPAVSRFTKKMAAGIAHQSSGDCEDKSQEIVFLPCRAKWWNTMEPMWRKAKENPLNEVHVLPIFYYDSDYNGAIGERHDETDFFPDYIGVEDCVRYDFESRHPAKIVIQVPYDDWSSVMTVHEFFYSRNLLQYTDELIYVPCFDPEPPIDDADKANEALAVLVEQPAVINADKIVLTSEKMKKFYVEKLVDLSGEETRSYWESKIVVADFWDDSNAAESLEKYSDCSSNGQEDEWTNLLGRNAGKKVVVYFINISFLLAGEEKAIDKIKRALEVFKGNSDKVFAIVVPQKQILSDLCESEPALWKKYLELVEDIKHKDYCIYDQEGISLKFIDKWDAYYGDSDAVARKCVLKGIPVMIENIDV